MVFKGTSDLLLTNPVLCCFKLACQWVMNGRPVQLQRKNIETKTLGEFISGLPKTFCSACRGFRSEVVILLDKTSEGIVI